MMMMMMRKIVTMQHLFHEMQVGMGKDMCVLLHTEGKGSGDDSPLA